MGCRGNIRAVAVNVFGTHTHCASEGDFELSYVRIVELLQRQTLVQFCSLLPIIARDTHVKPLLDLTFDKFDLVKVSHTDGS